MKQVRASVALLTLTTAPDADEAYGAARRFWHEMRRRYGEVTYFAWLELTRRGEVHYHAIVVNPPAGFFSARDKRWMERAWGHGYVFRLYRDARWFERSAGAYAASYAKKMGDKVYQQNYDEVPREMRTYMSNRLEHQVAELRPHEPHWDAVFIGSEPMERPGWFRDPYIKLVARDSCECGPEALRFVSQKDSRGGAQRIRRFRHYLVPGSASLLFELSPRGGEPVTSESLDHYLGTPDSRSTPTWVIKESLEALFNSRDLQGLGDSEWLDHPET